MFLMCDTVGICWHQEHIAIRCRIVQEIFISSFLVPCILTLPFSGCHSQDAILTLPFSGCAFSRCHSQDAHSHAAIITMCILTIQFNVQNYCLTHSHTSILRMPMLTLPFSGCAFSRCNSHNVQCHTYKELYVSGIYIFK